MQTSCAIAFRTTYFSLALPQPHTKRPCAGSRQRGQVYGVELRDCPRRHYDHPLAVLLRRTLLAYFSVFGICEGEPSSNCERPDSGFPTRLHDRATRVLVRPIRAGVLDELPVARRESRCSDLNLLSGTEDFGPCGPLYLLILPERLPRQLALTGALVGACKLIVQAAVLVNWQGYL